MNDDKSVSSEVSPSGSGIDRRRLLISGGVAAGGLTAFAAGYADTATKAVKGLAKGTAGAPTASATRGNSLKPEMTIDPRTGDLTMAEGHVLSPSMCFGCWTTCGVRVRVDQKANRIVRIAGNPYHPLATTSPVSISVPVRDVYKRLGGDRGLEGRATACARGASMFENVDSAFRVLQPMKRVGKRGEGRWQTISFEQLVKEVVEGGDLFGEGHVDGLRAIYDHKTLIDKDNPEYGVVANQLIVTDASNEGRTPLIQRFAQQAFGTVNYANHGSYCGQTYRVGTAASFGDISTMLHGKPDWANTRFGLFIGTAPAQAGNPFQRMGRRLAEGRTRDDDNSFDYVVVTPLLPISSNAVSGPDHWVGIKPSTDLAFVMAMIRWIIENDRYDSKFLAQPSPQAMKQAGEASWSNATHLLIAEPGHPRFGEFLRPEDLGLDSGVKPPAEDAAKPAAKPPAVYVVKRGDAFTIHAGAEPAEIFVDERVDIGAENLRVMSSLAMLRAEANRMTLDEYSGICGIPPATIIDIADRFTRFGKRAAANSHGGTMGGNGFYAAYAIAMLNVLIGNLNVKGGVVMSEGAFGPFGPGPRYNFAQFAGRRQPKGVSLSRHRSFRYENTSEHKRKVAAGEPPYPAKAPWYPAVGALSSEFIAAALAGYPYRAKVWINHMSNPMYAINGFRGALSEKLKDPKKLPLIISVDPFINETSAIADYIVPDTLTYESWGHGAPWADVVQKVSTVRWPVLEPRVGRDAQGRTIDIENFLISTAVQLGLPGFGKDAITDKAGGKYDLFDKEDFFLRGFANVAYAGGNAVPDASDDEIALTGVSRHLALLGKRLPAEEARKVAFLMTRGGRFGDEKRSWRDDHQVKPYEKALAIWNGDLARLRHTMTGEKIVGCPTYYPPRLASGAGIREVFSERDWPFMVCSFKSNLMSSISIGASRLRQVHPSNPVVLNRHDAARLGIANGDAIAIETPGGRVSGVALLRDGIVPGTIAVEFGYGHWEQGARSHIVDGRPTPVNDQIKAGVNMNLLGFADPTTPGSPNVWIDWVSGAVVRQGIPARLFRAEAGA
ncbi:tetrathionate reductase subunit TtrA [Tardiphaga alba]|uniref:Tetrathionate reductase subunit TtrA n=2 Tax=Tardiphaga alba TaxID=340268 RepID=A0ABX8AEN2_9BRAD|nr:tetrathionate reductase subunit TtrA [Tardiphaga alba]